MSDGLMSFIRHANEMECRKRYGLTCEQICDLAQSEVNEGRTFEFTHKHIEKVLKERKQNGRVYSQNSPPVEKLH